MQPVTSTPTGGARNHPLAFRMAMIGLINNNLLIACVWGTTSVLLASAEARLGVDRALSTLGATAVILATAIFAPLSGAAVTRVSLRTLQIAAAALAVCGFLLLATTASFPLYIIAYGLLIGPAMGAGVVLSPALVTRWYQVNRGRALGLICAPLLMVVMPVATSWALRVYGIATVYLILAGLMAISVFASLFIIDHPPATADTAGDGVDTVSVDDAPAPTAKQIFASGRFWAITLVYAASNMATVLFSSQIVAIAADWGVTPERAPVLLSTSSLTGIAGTLLFGALADRIGGARTLAYIAIVPAVLLPVLLLQPGFGIIVALVAVMGLHMGGTQPVTSFALSEAFGLRGIGMALGLTSLISVPFSVIWVPATALIFTHMGSYIWAIFTLTAFTLVTALALMLLFGSRAPRTARNI